MKYPFAPKSAVKLEHGHYWGIELIRGGWACGVVIEPMREVEPGNRTAIVAGLLDWKGAKRPTVDSLSGVASYLKITTIHFEAITWHGGEILGRLDEIPGDHADLVDFASRRVLARGHFLEPAAKVDRSSLNFLSSTNLKGFWGYAQSQIGKSPSLEIHARHDAMVADGDSAS